MGMGARLGWEVGMRGRGLVMRRVGVLVLVLVEEEGMVVSVLFLLSKTLLFVRVDRFSRVFRFSSLTHTCTSDLIRFSSFAIVVYQMI